MKIVSIEMMNYGPFHGTHNFNFSDRGLVLVQGDNQDEPRMNSNGAGKSSIFDALDWALFGKVPRGDHADSVTNEESKKCQVVVQLTDDQGKIVLVERRRGGKDSGVTLTYDGQEATALDSKETQRLIEARLGLDREVFHSAVLFGQFDLVHYADSTDSERMAILTKILRLDEIDGYLDRAKGQQKKAVMELEGLEVRAQAKANELQTLQDKDFAVRIGEWAERQAGEVNRLQTMAEGKTLEIESLEKEVTDTEALRTVAAALEGEIASMVGPDRSILKGVEESVLAASGEVSRIQGLYDQVKAKLTKFSAKGEGECPECGLLVTSDHLESVLSGLRNERGQYEAAHAAAKEVQTQWHNNKVALGQKLDAADKEFQDQKHARTTELAKLNQTIGEADRKAQALGRARTELGELQDMVESKKAEVNPYVEQDKENQDQIAKVEGELEGLEADQTEKKERIEYLDFWVAAFGAKGLKSYILDSRLQELTDAANQWVGLLSGGTIWVQFESQKKTRSKKVVNAPDVRVCRWNPDGSITERNFRSWSGGEKQRISFAIDFGLSRLIASRATQSYDILILDEVFRHLDQAGKEAVMDMLVLLAREKSSLIVVEHDNDFQASFENRITVRKKDRRSQIIEENASA